VISIKTCSKCGIEKSKKYFSKNKYSKDGFRSICKQCDKLRNKNWRLNNLNHCKETSRKWYETHREYHHECVKKWRKENPARNRKNGRNQYKTRITNTSYKISTVMSANIYHAIKSQKAGRHWEDLVGYTLYDLIKHLEVLFTPEITWDNYGSYWHIDHIRPKSWFDQTDPEQFKACWALNNLQPLEAELNLKKGDRWEG
jgi:hypothetical protein